MRVAWLVIVALGACRTDEVAPVLPGVKPRAASIALPVPPVVATVDAAATVDATVDREAEAEELADWVENMHQEHLQRVEDLDLDGNGEVSDAERTAARRTHFVEFRRAADADGDGRVTLDEIRASTRPDRYGDLAKLDSNTDGNVTVDELLEGNIRRRAARD